MKRYGIIAIGYNRIDSMTRLLNALDNVCYKEYKPTLIVSLDYAGMPEIAEMAEAFPWNHGEKIVRAYKERQGLRQHILNCGNYMEEYNLDAVAVFEDDVLPSPAFFNYMVQAVDFYGQDEHVAGISLYTHLWNTNCELPFTPVPEQYDTFFIQYAQSWGQVWLRKQWNDFKVWYQANSANYREAEGVPSSVANWKDSSWLKYHIRYCVDQKKYFVYPYDSLCTNYTDVGTHNAISTALYQVPLQLNADKTYRFGVRENSLAVYDAYFENQKLTEKLQLSPEEVCVDLYGSKESVSGKKYWLTMKSADYEIIKTYGLSVKPHEINVLLEIKGEDIKLYDLSKPVKQERSSVSDHRIRDYYYRMAHCRSKELLKEIIDRVKRKVKSYRFKRK